MLVSLLFFFNDTATTEIYTLSLHDALPIWYRDHIGGGRTPVADTWWQTETGMILITPLPGVTTLKPGSATRPFPGIEADIVNEAGESVPLDSGGYLVLKKPWPSMMRTNWGGSGRDVPPY